MVKSQVLVLTSFTLSHLSLVTCLATSEWVDLMTGNSPDMFGVLSDLLLDRLSVLLLYPTVFITENCLLRLWRSASSGRHPQVLLGEVTVTSPVWARQMHPHDECYDTLQEAVRRQSDINTLKGFPTK